VTTPAREPAPEPARGGARARARALEWLGALLSPRTAGMADTTPRCNPLALGLMLGSLALLVVARYKWGFLEDKNWQLVHVLIGWTACISIFVLFHGFSALARVRLETWFVLGFGLTCFMLFWYFGRSDGYRRFFGDPPLDYDTLWPIVPFMYFATMGTLLRLVIPLIAQRWLFGRRPADLGFPVGRGHREGAVPGIGWVYVALFLGMFPLLTIVAQTPPFQAKYPLARDLIDPDGGIWWVHLLVFQGFYFLVFLSGEGFWRGYLTFGTEKDLGLYGLAFMAVPYVTAHFGKPFSETLGAIAAGTALGFLALRHRSIWWGVALHYAVALSMDLLSIANQGAVIYASGPPAGPVP